MTDAAAGVAYYANMAELYFRYCNDCNEKRKKYYLIINYGKLHD